MRCNCNIMKSRLMVDEQLFRFMRYGSELISQYFIISFSVWLKPTLTGHYPLQLVNHLRHKTRWDSLLYPTMYIVHTSHWHWTIEEPDNILLVAVQICLSGYNSPENPTIIENHCLNILIHIQCYVEHPVVIIQSEKQLWRTPFIPFH